VQFTRQGETTKGNHQPHENDQDVQAKERDFAGGTLPSEQARRSSTFSAFHINVSVGAGWGNTNHGLTQENQDNGVYFSIQINHRGTSQNTLDSWQFQVGGDLGL
jgi:hypothetical protein